LHGQDDPMVSIEELAAFAAEMKRVDADWQLHCCPGVMHAFTNPKANDLGFGTVYAAAADRRSWQAMLSFVTESMNA
jgi:dienelactone hydrolase